MTGGLPIRLEDADRDRIAALIDRHRATLEDIKGFVDAEPGFPIVDGWVRREPAIVVHVERKVPASELLLEDLAPRALEGVRVDLVTADPWRLLASNADTAGLHAALEGVAAAAPTYKKLDDNPIDERLLLARPILCHAGPDAGWPVLKQFLEGTRETLTVAMYDLNAAYVSKTLVETVRGGNVRLVLVWDSGMTPDETEIRREIKAKLGARLDAWVVRTGGGYRFDSAYHEKVAVRDASSFWLSSGNWSKRSQPEIDPVGTPGEARGMYSKGNREWHVVVEDAALSGLFEQYIRYDRDESEAEDTALGQPDPVLLPDLFVPIDALLPDDDLALAAVVPVAPARLPAHGRAYAVQPVLCPDNYIERITTLIKSARRSLYLQFSYITYSSAPRDKPFQDLLDAIGTLSHRPDFDLRIIVGNNSAEDKVRILVQSGFNEARIRVQSNVHNKGIIVDGKAVLISSANWSSAGALRNRDAGIIVYDPDVASYYQKIFVDDWEQRARANFGVPRPVRLAGPDDPTPPVMARVRWRDIVDD